MKINKKISTFLRFFAQSVELLAVVLFSCTWFLQAEAASGPKPNQTVLEELLSKGLDPRISRIVPESLVKAIPAPILREVPTPTEPRKVELLGREVVIFPNISLHPSSTTTQSEMSIAVHPLNPDVALAGANAAHINIEAISQGWYYSTDGGSNWAGGDTLPTHTDLQILMSDPAVGIDLDGNLFFNALEIFSTFGNDVFVARSTDNGFTWSEVRVPNAVDGDKNHLAIDINPSSPFANYLYTAYTDFGSVEPFSIMFSRSTDRGVSFSSQIPISGNVGSLFAQGVNLAVGPSGELYAAWSGYDEFPPLTTHLGFNKSTDGGASWQEARTVREVKDIRGFLFKGENFVRVNSFPSMVVDRSNSSRRGWIYIVYAEYAPDTPDIFLIRSTDGGNSWSAPRKVNQDVSGNDQWFPWIAVDPLTSALYVVYYDSRNFPENDSAQVFVSTSLDGGETFEDVIVSDVTFLPAPIPGLAAGYMGDYIGISALNGVVWPCWNDNRTGIHQAYASRMVFVEAGKPATINISPDTLDFGEVFLGYPETLGVAIRNLGFPDTLVISDIQSSSVDFVPEVTSFILPGAQGRNLKVAFNPSVIGPISAVLTVYSNDTANLVDIVQLQATVVHPPVLAVTPDSVALTLNEGDSTSFLLSVQNIGLGNLNFSLSRSFASGGRLFGIRNDQILEIDLDTKEIINSFPTPVVPFFDSTYADKGLAFSGKELFFTIHCSFNYPCPTSQIFVLNPRTGAILDSFPKLAGVPQPEDTMWGGSLAFVDGKLYVSKYIDPRREGDPFYFYELDASDGSFLRKIRIIPDLAPFVVGDGLDGGNGRLFGSTGLFNRIQEINIADGSILNSFPVPLPEGSPPSGLAFTGTRLFAGYGPASVYGPPAWGIDEYDPNTGTYLGKFSPTLSWINSLAGGGGLWLSTTATGGNLPPGGSQDIQVKVRADELNGGTYRANVLVSSNDPAHPIDTVSVVMTVIGTPNIVLSTDTLDFEEAFVGFPDTLNLRITNIHGSDRLDVSGMSISNPRFGIIGDSIFNLPMGKSQDVRITFLPADTGSDSATLAITSNDPDQPVALVRLIGKGVSRPIVAAFPDSFAFALLTGDSAQAALTLTNSGQGNLEYSITDNLSLSGLVFGALNNKIYKFDFNTQTWLDSFPTPISMSGGGTGLAASNRKLYFTEAGSTTNIYVLDRETGVVLDSFPAPSSFTIGLAIVDGKLYASNYSADVIYELNPTNGDILRTLSPPIPPGSFLGGGLDGGNGRLFASDAFDKIYELDLSDGSIVRSFFASSPNGLGFTGSRLFASHSGGVSEYDPTTGEFLGGMSLYQSFYALAGAGPDWVSENLSRSILLPSQSQEILVKVRTMEIDNGSYQASVFINSNDPAQPKVTIPVGLSIGGECLSIPGDATSDGRVSPSDLVFLINHLFKSRPAPDPLCRGDVNMDGRISSTDLVFLINYLFKRGSTPLKSGVCCL